MKVRPFPDKKLKNVQEVENHISELFFGALSWLEIAGYIFWVWTPGQPEFKEHKGAGLSILVDHPYKKFNVSVQQDSVDKMLQAGLDSPVWAALERSVFHECFHILTWHMTDIAQKRYTTPGELDDADESLVDHLANTVYPMVKEIRGLRTKKK